ncbi:MAG: 1-deoxy-D-xylulose-5-phosphate reductoisomerase, partial [Candidatus Gastranaerophilales bacterium]|nr:1-deoxy-D-xylulose-5-phosphate reductoisomerase [Candidatus Gastranaerophilales bacterium]
MKTISILGSIGSIGTQALEVVEKNKDRFRVYALACGGNINLLREQIQKFRPEKVSVGSKEHALEIEKEFPKLEVLYGQDGLVEIAQDNMNSQILVALSGFAGLYPTLAAINSGIDIALANKETLVTAGDIIMQRVKTQGVKLLPVDSEHSAIYQCICGDVTKIRKLLITASGGPFRTWDIEDIKNATAKQALAHPKWNMGRKITIDSATLMNKGLEIIEAHHLFDVKYDDIDVVVHPQSIIHSAVEHHDGSVIAQLGLPSMHIPIQYALTFPDRVEGIKTGSFDFVKAQNLTFEAPDFDKFPCLKLAYESGRQGGTCPSVMNGANEEAVMAFLDEKITLNDIYRLTE